MRSTDSDIILKLSTQETKIDPRVNKQIFGLNKLYPITVKEEPAEPESKFEPAQPSDGIDWATDTFLKASEDNTKIFQ